MVVNEYFYVFVKRMEMVVRQILNKSLIITYKGENLRDVLLVKLEENELLDRSWSGMTKNIENKELVGALKTLIFRKWMATRVKAFVNAWIQSVKRKANEFQAS